MIKHIKYMTAHFLFVLAACSIFSSCKNYLDTKPTGLLTDATFWKSQDDALAGINACYATLRNTYLYGYWGQQMYSTLSPNAFSDDDASGYQYIAEGIQDASNAPIANNRWGADYQGIGRTNSVIHFVPKIEMDTALRRRITGEAYFLRAFYYQDLVNYYGGVPLILDPPDLASQVSLARTSKDSVLAQIYKDLDSAAAILPVSYSSSDVGRATKGAALALKARVLLYQNKWSEAAAAEKQVMDLHQYSLFPDYRDLFLPANENNAEVIFDVQFSMPNYPNSFDVNEQRYYNYAPTRDLEDAYDMKDGLPPGLSPLSYDSMHPWVNRDPRLLQTLVLPGTYYCGALVTKSTYPTHGTFKKYTIYQDSVKPAAILSDQQSETNYMVIRYAEVLLSYAEATNEATGPDQSVTDAINAVRARAGIGLLSGIFTQDSLRKIIRHERRIEFAGEGLYYDDIRRWKIAPEVMNESVYDFYGIVVQKRAFNTNRDYLWPIPSVELQENKNLEQNPGYNN